MAMKKHHESKKHEKRESKKHEKNEKKKKAGKVGKVMREFEAGSLHSGSKKGPKVTNPKQAIAIGLSEARKKGEKVSPKPQKKKKKEHKKSMTWETR
jgi:hypothetical protein